jgi:hypothetical protein
MRGSRMNGYIGEFKDSFLCCEKDTETIIKKLFVDSRPYSDMLKRLLLINTPDCLTDMTNPKYLEIIKKTSIQDLHSQGYLRFAPKIFLGENEQVKSYIRISYDHFTPSENEHFRDCIVEIDILCHSDYWELDDYRQRPIKIAGYIDGILNKNKLSGIGTLNFAGCNELVLDENLSGYCLMYTATHGSDDYIKDEVE